MAWEYRWITVYFTVDDKFRFSCKTSASVNVDSDGELLDDYMEDVEYIEDLEFEGFVGEPCDENEIPIEDDLDESHIVSGYIGMHL